MAERIKSERKCLNLTQGTAAKIAKISREAWNKCELGKVEINVKILIALIKAGADVIYILTGERSSNIALLPHEMEMLFHFRKAIFAVQTAALGALKYGNQAVKPDVKR